MLAQVGKSQVGSMLNGLKENNVNCSCNCAHRLKSCEEKYFSLSRYSMFMDDLWLLYVVAEARPVNELLPCGHNRDIIADTTLLISRISPFPVFSLIPGLKSA